MKNKVAVNRRIAPDEVRIPMGGHLSSMLDELIKYGNYDTPQDAITCAIINLHNIKVPKQKTET